MPHMQHLTPCTHTHTHTFNGPFSGLPGWAGTRKAKPIWILLKQETVSGSGISWAICKSAPRSRQITMPVPHHSSFYRPDALSTAQPTASKHWRNILRYARPNNTHVGRCKLSLILTLTPTLIRHPHTHYHAHPPPFLPLAKGPHFLYLWQWELPSMPSVLWHCWLGGRKGIRPVKKSGGVLAWLSVSQKPVSK